MSLSVQHRRRFHVASAPVADVALDFSSFRRIDVLKALQFNNLYRVDSIATSVVVSGAAAAVSRLVGLVRGVALAWLIPQGQFGLFGVALLVVNVLLPVCSAGLYEGVTRYVPLHESAGTLRRFLVRSSVLAVGLALATTVILSLCADAVGSVLFSTAQIAPPAGASSLHVARPTALTQACLICVMGLTAYHMLLGALKGLRMFRAHSTVELVTTCLFTLLALGGALSGFRTASALMLAYAISCVVVVLIFAPGLIVHSAPQPEPSPDKPPQGGARILSRTLTYSLWAAATAVLWHLLSYYPIWYLLKVSDSRTAGTFHAVRIITQLIQVAAVAVTAVVAANVNRLWEHDGREIAVSRLTLLTKVCLIALIAGATVLSVARPAVMRLFPSGFAAGDGAYDPLVLFFLIVGIIGLFAIRLNLLEKPRLVCLAWLAGAAVNVTASFVLLGVSGEGELREVAGVVLLAAWAGVAGATAALIVCVGLVRREDLALDLPTIVLTVLAFSVALGWPVAVVVLALVIAAGCWTDLVFSARERAMLRVNLGHVTGP